MSERELSRRELLALAAAGATGLASGTGNALAQEPANEWKNWSGSVVCHPGQMARPTTTDDVVAAVRDAAARNHTVRAVGSGHSFVPLGASDDVVMVLARMRGVESIDAEKRQATVLGGTKLYHLGRPLREAGLAMKNLPDIDRQGVAGSVATATHGTGPAHGNLSTHVVGLEIVTGGGDVVGVSAEDRPDLLRAASVSLGALGILTRITLQLEPTYRLHEKRWRASYDEMVEGLEKSIADNEHFEFFWVSQLDACLLKTLNKTDDEQDFDRPDADNLGGERQGPWDEVYPSVRNTPFNEIEYAVPADRGPDCLAELRELMRGRHRDVTWPLEYRTVAADDLPLSPAFGGPIVTISAHEPVDRDEKPFFRDAEAVFRNHSGRPHWGKMHWLGADELAPLYPGWDSFQKARAELDPEGVFQTPYLRHLLG